MREAQPAARLQVVNLAKKALPTCVWMLYSNVETRTCRLRVGAVTFPRTF